MDDVNYIVFADQGLVTYRFDLPGGDVREFEDPGSRHPVRGR